MKSIKRPVMFSFPQCQTRVGPRFRKQTTPLRFFRHGSAERVLSSKDTAENTTPGTLDNDSHVCMYPREIVNELNRYVIGQEDAKKAFAIALRSRWRRLQLSSELQKEVIPKNMLVIGSTGVGKTEIARRVAKLYDAPFLKVEATRYTEVGYKGKDVESIIVDLVELTIRQIKEALFKKLNSQIQAAVEEKVLDSLCGPDVHSSTREAFRTMFRKGMLDDRYLELDSVSAMTAPEPDPVPLPSNSGDEKEGFVLVDIQGLLQGPQQTSPPKNTTVSAYRSRIEQAETERIADKAVIARKAIEVVEQRGIVFIDEIDKICVNKDLEGKDNFHEGVQKDLLPLIEGTTVSTKHGNVDTSKILFIASGAFHSCKPSDLLSELQGRLPIRIQMSPLTEKDFYNILVNTDNSLIKQQEALLNAEGIQVKFTDEAIHEIAALSARLNTNTVNIGARRLHTIIEKIMEDISFNCEEYRGSTVTIDSSRIEHIKKEILLPYDLQRHII